MSEYKINYYYADTLVGHFYVQFEGQLPSNIAGKGARIFGKNPAIPLMPIAAGEVIDESKIHLDKSKKKILVSTSVTSEQFESAYQLAVNSLEKGGLYHGTIDNCISFNQDIYRATGGKGHFINLFPKSELQNSGTMAAKEAMKYYESNNFRFVTGLTADLVALRYGVTEERVIENLSLNVDSTGRPTHSKSFIIKPDPEIDDSTYNEDNIKTEEEHSGYQPERNMINDFFKYYDAPEIHEEGINNLQRFERMHERAKLEGDNEFAGMFKNLAGAHKQVFDFLDNLNQEEDL